MLPSVLQPNATDHVPVLAEEVRRLVDVQPGDTVIDATFGAGGHAALIAPQLQGKGKYIAVDRDPSVRPYFESFRRRAGVQTRFLRGDFADVFERLADNGVRGRAHRRRDVSRLQVQRRAQPGRCLAGGSPPGLAGRGRPLPRAGSPGVRSGSS